MSENSIAYICVAICVVAFFAMIAFIAWCPNRKDGDK